MSKTKKTIEELLEEALVPEEEQPYVLPENWVWTNLETICKYIQRGKSPKYIETSIAKVVSQKCVQWSGFDINVARYIDESSLKSYSEERFLRRNDILWNSTGTGTIGRVALIEDELEGIVVADSHVTVVRANNNIADSRLLYRWLSSPYVQDKLNNSWSGSTNQVELNLTTVKKQSVPIPPVNEQKRIAEKVERLLNKIEEAKELIEEAKETFELRRASILDKAFRGEITKRWRRVNENVENAEVIYRKIKDAQTGKGKKIKDINQDEINYNLPLTWKWVRLGDVFIITSGGTPSRTVSEYYEGQIPWIKTGEIKWNYIYASEERITPDAVANSSAKLLPKNTVLVAMYGQGLTRGRAAMLGIDATCNQAVCALLPNDYILPEFLFYYFMEGYQRFRQVAKGGNQENLSATVISDFLFPLPPLEEQREIVLILNNIFKKETLINELITLDLTVEELEQSILSKAFRGELGTNDPSEESAIDLLKEMLQEQIK